MWHTDDTIAAPATAAGGALAVIRISGPSAIDVCDKCFTSVSSKTLKSRKGRTVHYGTISDPKGSFIDEVLVTIFRSPASYTGEDMAEISCHGSKWIISEIMHILARHGVRTAEAGEFTVRAFLAGKLDLAQAEAVADMISSRNRASHDLAASQLRGAYSAAILSIRGQLLKLTSLLELELDFSEEDVSFADRAELSGLLDRAGSEISRLLQSFSLGNALKEGIAVAIVGAPNVGKSTLLNRLVGEERAMVSDIAGTTRDSIEETVTLGGIGFRFIDTAGLHDSGDTLELMGMERTYKMLSEARIVLYVTDASGFVPANVTGEVSRLQLENNGQKAAILVNKCDEVSLYNGERFRLPCSLPVIPISAKYGLGIDNVTRFLTSCIDASTLYAGDTIVSNARHYQALCMAASALAAAQQALACDMSPDLIAEELRTVLDALGTITGEITTEEILTEIFSKFCIGK